VLNYFKKYVSHGKRQSKYVELTGIMTRSGNPGCLMEIHTTQMNQFKEVCE